MDNPGAVACMACVARLECELHVQAGLKLLLFLLLLLLLAVIVVVVVVVVLSRLCRLVLWESWYTR